MNDTSKANKKTLLLKAEEVADMLAISTRSLYRLVSAPGKFPKPVKLGGSTRWREAEVVAWVRRVVRKCQTIKNRTIKEQPYGVDLQTGS